MQLNFSQPPAAYRAETRSVPWFWWVFCPVAAPLVLVAYAYLDPAAYRTYLQAEDSGLLEFLHAALPLAAAAIAARLLSTPEVRRDPLIVLWLALFVVGGIYLGGEEASWGQHYFGWATPEGWAEINRQKETNLHNTSFFFDRLPRIVVTVGILVGGLVLPFLKLRGSRIIPARLDFIVPPLALTVLALVFALGEIYGGLSEYFPAVEAVTKFRPGEMQENFIAPFIFFYMIFLRRRAFTIRSSESLAHVASGQPPEKGPGSLAPGG